MQTDDDFTHAMNAFVEGIAGGNKALASRLLQITRPEIYRYCRGVVPHDAKKARLLSILVPSSADDDVRTEAEGTGSDARNVSPLLEALKYVIRLIEEDVRAQS